MKLTETFVSQASRAGNPPNIAAPLSCGAGFGSLVELRGIHYFLCSDGSATL